MFRLWGKMWKDNHMLKDLVIDDDSEDTRTHKIFHALQEICYDFDLENPIWLESNISDFKRHSKPQGKGVQRPDFARTVLLNISSLIILKSR
jgi:hypothetical protein